MHFADAMLRGGAANGSDTFNGSNVTDEEQTHSGPGLAEGLREWVQEALHLATTLDAVAAAQDLGRVKPKPWTSTPFFFFITLEPRVECYNNL